MSNINRILGVLITKTEHMKLGRGRRGEGHWGESEGSDGVVMVKIHGTNVWNSQRIDAKFKEKILHLI